MKRLIKDILHILFAPLSPEEKIEYKLWVDGEIEL